MVQPVELLGPKSLGQKLQFSIDQGNQKNPVSFKEKNISFRYGCLQFAQAFILI